MTEQNLQSLFEAIDSLADARANLAVVQYRLAKREIAGDGPEVDRAAKIVTETQSRLHQALHML